MGEKSALREEEERRERKKRVGLREGEGGKERNTVTSNTRLKQRKNERQTEREADL